MKNKKLIELFNSLNSLQGLEGVKFNYAIAKNVAKMKVEVESLEKSLEYNEDFITFEKERVELAKTHSKKDANGEAMTEKTEKESHFVLLDKTLFNKELETLKETHKEAIDKREKQLKDFEALLEIENNIELFKIKLSDIPETIKTEQLRDIYTLIEE